MDTICDICCTENLIIEECPFKPCQYKICIDCRDILISRSENSCPSCFKNYDTGIYKNKDKKQSIKLQQKIMQINKS